MAFFQAPPLLGNQFDDDALLQEYLARALPEDQRPAASAELRELGERSGKELYALQLADRLNEPTLTQWDAWGNRVDRIEVTALWKEAQRISARHGLVATGYEKRHGPHARTLQFALNYVVQPSLDVYSCPLAMTDGAARTLLEAGNRGLIDRAVPRLTSRDPLQMWTSGQWMTERTGGSDVGISETQARKSPEGWRLYGTKWFTSATTAEMALTLARPEGNGPGGRGLALFYVETRDGAGRMNGIQINRLKDKLGTRKVPTAELTLDGALAVPVLELENGVRNITPMLNVTRTWNAMGAAWGMRRAVALARDYAKRRVQFGALLSDKPLHVDTLAGLEAEAQAGFLFAFRAAELMGQIEAGTASDFEKLLFRLVTPLAKLTTGKQVVAVCSEALECFGGAGYVEDTGLPLMLRDAQVLPIWEGTTNVLSLDTLRAMGKDPTYDALREEIHARVSAGTHASLRPAAETALRAMEHATAWISEAMADPRRVEAGARRFALTLGRTLELALLIDHGQWAFDHRKTERGLAAARRFAQGGVDLLSGASLEDAQLLAGPS